MREEGVVADEVVCAGSVEDLDRYAGGARYHRHRERGGAAAAAASKAATLQKRSDAGETAIPKLTCWRGGHPKFNSVTSRTNPLMALLQTTRQQTPHTHRPFRRLHNNNTPILLLHPPPRTTLHSTLLLLLLDLRMREHDRHELLLEGIHEEEGRRDQRNPEEEALKQPLDHTILLDK